MTDAKKEALRLWERCRDDVGVNGEHIMAVTQHLESLIRRAGLEYVEATLDGHIRAIDGDETIRCAGAVLLKRVLGMKYEPTDADREKAWRERRAESDRERARHWQPYPMSLDWRARQKFGPKWDELSIDQRREKMYAHHPEIMEEHDQRNPRPEVSRG